MSNDSVRPVSHGALEGSASQDDADASDADASASLHPDLWRAMVSETVGVRWFLDLNTYQVVRASVPEGGSASPDDPGRYAEVPTLPTERQRSHARRVLTDLVGEEQAKFLTSEEPWLRHFHEHASAELRQTLSDARRAWVIAEVRAWLRDHDVPEQRFVRLGRSAARDTRPTRAPRTRVLSLREAIHRAVDRMSERELEALPIPGRLLVDE